MQKSIARSPSDCPVGAPIWNVTVCGAVSVARSIARGPLFRSVPFGTGIVTMYVWPTTNGASGAGAIVTMRATGSY